MTAGFGATAEPLGPQVGTPRAALFGATAGCPLGLEWLPAMVPDHAVRDLVPVHTVPMRRRLRYVRSRGGEPGLWAGTITGRFQAGGCIVRA
jgi:hypothetical protein